MTDTMSLAELIEEEKSLAAAVANATAVAKASKAAHKAAAERLARYKIGYSSIWRSFATRLQIEKQKRQKLLVNLHDIDIRNRSISIDIVNQREPIDIVNQREPTDGGNTQDGRSMLLLRLPI